MKKRLHFRSFLLGFIVCLVITGSTVAFGSSISKSIDVVYDNIKIVVNGVLTNPSDEPFFYNDRTYVPLRFVAEALGEKVNFDADNMTISIGEDTSTSASTASTDLTSADGKTQVSMPDGWVKGNLSPLAKIQFVSKDMDAYFMTISESKKSIGDTFKLQDYCNLVLKAQEEKITNAKKSEIKKISVNGCPALQYTISGQVQKVNIAYLVTIIETDTYYNQVLGWVVGDSLGDKENIFKEIANSFKEVAM